MPEWQQTIEHSESLTLDYRYTGTARHRILLLHACGSGARPLHRLVDALCHDGDYQAVIPQLHGYGASRHHQSLSSPLAQHRALIDHLLHSSQTDSRHWHLVGHSMGGFLALKSALAWPDRIRSVTAIEPMAFGVLDPTDPDDAGALAADRHVIARFSNALQAGRAEQGLAAFIGYWNDTPWLQLPDAMRTVLIGLSEQMRAEATAISYDPTPASAYHRLDIPVQLLVGERTRPPAQRIIQRLQQNLPQAQTRLINGAGHMGPLTHPQVFAQIIKDFIGKLC